MLTAEMRGTVRRALEERLALMTAASHARYYIVIGGVVAAGTVALLMFWIWQSAEHRNRVNLETLTKRFDAHLADIVKRDDAIRTELDEMRRTLYTDIDTNATANAAVAANARRPSAVELWQVGRDKKFEDRIARIERRLTFAVPAEK